MSTSKTFGKSALIGAALLACSGSTSVRAADPDTISIGVIPFEEIQLTAEKFKGVVEVIEKATGKKVEWHFPTSYAALIEAQRRGFVHIGYYGPESYILANKSSDGRIEAFAQTVWGGGDYRKKEIGYHSFLIVKADSPYKNVADLKGKTLALVNPTSTSGNLVPRVELGRSLGVKIDKHFGSVFYAGSHTAAMQAILAGKAESASVADVTLDWAVDKKEIDAKTFRVIWTSSLLPLDPFAWRKDLLSDELRKTIRDAILTLSETPAGKEFLRKTRSDSVEAASDRNFDAIRQVSKDLKKWE